ncbi:glycoside hydrolase family 3 protein [Tabrizicola oligotrophica]|uniref:beta-N-acetylhexosaminidase n=1 Tax=Tabrizicola oligotrophica TaxID=2710650 RepID=A0A6M0QNX9_9RHOB|nr:glycoside hydrolase family 3 protein [Tabrizicola oligotrophica]NEY88956.1 glycoside hydrolase family 3 protein [Tabrizicola oligotrophica]
MSAIGRMAAIFGCDGFDLSGAERAFFREADPFGFILFARNIDNPDQVERLTRSLREAVGRDAPILIDQEGGRVQRLRSPHWREWIPPLDAAETAGADAARVLGLRARIMAEELRALGIDANCAPVADIAGPETHPFLRNRCYGVTPVQVYERARAVAEAHLAAGVLPVVKHLPGHGRATADTHLHLPTVTASRAELAAHDFAPFKALADLPLAMTAHIIFAAYDPDRPATQSPDMIRVIRQEIGFQGLLMTDDLNMQALSGDLGQRTRAAMAAGCDIALHCKGDMAEMLQVAAEAGDMRPDTRARAGAALARRRPANSVDIAALAADLAAMGQGALDG